MSHPSAAGRTDVTRVVVLVSGAGSNLAALLAVPPELYDAAEVDGASIWHKIWHVTLPQLRGVILIMLILQVIATATITMSATLPMNQVPYARKSTT